MGLEPTNLLTASQALYQLSYAPEGWVRLAAGGTALAWSGQRPGHLLAERGGQPTACRYIPGLRRYYLARVREGTFWPGYGKGRSGPGTGKGPQTVAGSAAPVGYGGRDR